jgi:hypothetical protein
MSPPDCETIARQLAGSELPLIKHFNDDNLHKIEHAKSRTPLRTVSGLTLMKTDYPPPVFRFDGLLHNGVTMLNGRPKVGKSWLALQLAVDAAMGRNGFGRFPVTSACSVLYVGLEESEGRTSNRLKRFIDVGEPCAVMAENLQFVYELEPLLKGGIEQLDDALNGKLFGLVVIDTFLAALRQQRGKNADALQEDYRAVKALQEFAQRHETAVLLIHHTRKMAAEYALDAVAGTTGLTAAADSIWILNRGASATFLTIQGRDMADTEFALRFDQQAAGFGWSVIGTGEEARVSDVRTEILQLLKDASSPMTPKAIADELKRNRATVRRILMKMRNDGQVSSTDEGYRL